MYQIRKQSAAYSEGFNKSPFNNPYAPCTIAHADYVAGMVARGEQFMRGIADYAEAFLLMTDTSNA